MLERDPNGNMPRAGQQRLSILTDETTLPPATRAECAGIARPCPRYACRHHLWPNTERAGRPHHGTHNVPTGIADAIADGATHSCALDVAEAGEELDNVQVAAKFPPRPKQKRKVRTLSDVEPSEKITPGITKERIRQIAERGLDKQWGALAFVAAFDRFIAEFGDAGGTIDFLWGTIMDDEGNAEGEVRNDPSRVYVTIALNTSKVVRPRRAEVREMQAAGVRVRRRIS